VRRGAHAAADGSFGRSAAGHAGRGAALLFVALLIGIGLLQSTDRSDTIGTTAATPTTSKPTATAPPPTTSTTAAVPAHDPAAVKVLSANGTVTDGVGAKLQTKLRTAGYNTLSPVTSSTKLDTSQIFFAAGFQPDALAIATLLGLPASAVAALPAKPPVTVGSANVVVIAGKDVLPKLAAASTTASTVQRAPTATTSTTAHTTATTVHSSSTTSTTKKP
jgi:predicted flap endonuclease-1-like 5' DNA nuclease